MIDQTVKRLKASRGNKKQGLAESLLIEKFYAENYKCIFNGAPCMACHPGACSFRLKKEDEK